MENLDKEIQEIEEQLEELKRKREERSSPWIAVRQEQDGFSFFLSSSDSLSSTFPWYMNQSC